ncbi:flavoprotein [Skermania sp. ID1734]|nr:flavoprotein [Skermania sp. ID1734]
MALVRTNFRSVTANPQGGTKLITSFYSHLFGKNPDFRALFPVSLHSQRERFFAAIKFVVDNLDNPARVMTFLEQLGRDHRKYGVEAGHYNAAGAALLAALREYTGDLFWTNGIDAAWREVIAMLVEAMANGAESDDLPAHWEATVVGHRRVLDNLAIIRLLSDEPIPYEAGQYLPVRIPQRPMMWRYLSPAIPSNSRCEIEFHVRKISGGWVSPSLVNETKVGDRWKLGAPLGGMRVYQDGADVLMVSSGTGLAPLRAQIMEMTFSGVNPRVHLFLGGRHPCDLYDLETMWRISQFNPWLTVVPVVEQPNDPWWYSGPSLEIPEGMEGLHIGRIGQVVTRYGAWKGHQIQVSGSPLMIRSTIAALSEVGIPPARVQHDPV